MYAVREFEPHRVDLAMEFFLFWSLLLVASASASPLSDSSPKRDNESQANVTSSFVKVREICVATEHRYYSPALVLVGTSNQVMRCLYEDPEQCEVLYTTGSEVRSLLVVGEFVYVGLYEKILRCNLNQAESCEVYQVCNSFVNSLAARSGHLYVGLETDGVFICRLDELNSCRIFHTFERASSVYALIQINEYIYVGLWNGKIMRCSLETESNCTHMYTTGTGIIGFSNVGNSIFAVLHDDSRIWRCVGKFDAFDTCESVPILGYSTPRDIASFDGILYTVKQGEGIYICQWAKDTNCTKYGKINNAYIIEFAYATYPMHSRYENEDTTCTWQSETKCPPVVTYYGAQQRTLLEVHVTDGRLYNSQGLLVDTSAADEGHVGPAAIFAMGPDGRILLSNLHKKGLLHTSSFFSGKPVAGAGEMVVKNGVIQEIRACSDHYQADTNMNRQVIQSLRAQGYTDHIDSVPCTEVEYKQFESNFQ